MEEGGLRAEGRPLMRGAWALALGKGLEVPEVRPEA
jgi:hypothetical protein